MTVKEELRALVETMPDEHAAEVLDYARWLAADTDTLTEEEMEEVRAGEAELARGEYVTLDDVLQRHGL